MTREIVVRPPAFRIAGMYAKDRRTWGARVCVDTPRGPVHFEVTVTLPEALDYLARATFDHVVKRMAGKLSKRDSAGGWNPWKRIRKMAAAVRTAAISTANRAISTVVPAPLRPLVEKPLQAVAKATDPATYAAAVRNAVNKLGTTTIPGTNLSIRSLSKFGTVPFVAAKVVARAAARTIKALPPEAMALATGNPLTALSKLGQRVNIPGAEYLSKLDPGVAATEIARRLGVPGASVLSAVARVRQGDLSSVVPALEQAPEAIDTAQKALASAPDVLSTVTNLTGAIVESVAGNPRTSAKVARKFLARKAALMAKEYTTDAASMRPLGVPTVHVSSAEKKKAETLITVLRGVGRNDPKSIAILQKISDQASKGDKGARDAWLLAVRIGNAARVADVRDTMRGALTISHGGKKGALTIVHDAAGDGSGDNYAVPGMLPPPSPSHAMLAGYN
jgi:hypothetical protein